MQIEEDGADGADGAGDDALFYGRVGLVMVSDEP